MKNKALGMIETYGYIGAIEAADVCVKAANVKLVGCELVKGGLVTIHIRGDVAAVKASIDAAKIAVMKVGKLISTHVIPRPSKDVERILPNPDPQEPEENEGKDIKEDAKDDDGNKEEIEEVIPEEDSSREDNGEKTNREETEETEDDDVDEGEESEEDQDDDVDEKEINSFLKTRDELEKIKTVKLRSLARKLDAKYETPFPIERNQIKYARKKELIDAIMEYYEGVK